MTCLTCYTTRSSGRSSRCCMLTCDTVCTFSRPCSSPCIFGTPCTRLSCYRRFSRRTWNTRLPGSVCMFSCSTRTTFSTLKFLIYRAFCTVPPCYRCFPRGTCNTCTCPSRCSMFPCGAVCTCACPRRCRIFIFRTRGTHRRTRCRCFPSSARSAC